MGLKFDKGDSYTKTKKFMEDLMQQDFLTSMLHEYGRRGVEALSAATPVDSGLTAMSWDYEIERGDGYTYIYWTNGNIVDEWFNVALYLQYGHGTNGGGWVEGRDYINPAIQPIFDEMVTELWAEVKKL